MSYRVPLKIRFADVDRAGIVYYPRFLHYFHVALEEFFGSQLGIDYHVLVNEHRLGLPTVHLETDFSQPIAYGETMEVEVRVQKVGHSSVTFGYRTFKPGGSEPCNAGHNVTVCVNMDTSQKQTIPDWLRERLEHSLMSNE